MSLQVTSSTENVLSSTTTVSCAEAELAVRRTPPNAARDNSCFFITLIKLKMKLEDIVCSSRKRVFISGFPSPVRGGFDYLTLIIL